MVQTIYFLFFFPPPIFSKTCLEIITIIKREGKYKSKKKTERSIENNRIYRKWPVARAFLLKELMQLDMAEASIYKVSRRKKSGIEGGKKDEGKKGRKNVLSGYNFYSVAGIIEYYIAVFTCLVSGLYF